MADRPIKVSLNRLVNVPETSEEAKFIHKAVGALRHAINQPDFFGKLATADFPASRHLESKITTKERIREIIKNGLELGALPDQEIDLTIIIDDTIRNPVIGKTALYGDTIRTGRWFIAQCISRSDVISLAAHFMHEWLHLAGFYHKKSGIQKDVAYIVGNIVRDVLMGHQVDEADDDFLTEGVVDQEELDKEAD
mmetsp:Transcript_14892/g.26202  ORF Transcript_14892/g.26202 Transcript_14892/m.26202 type:complete len:195 (-) Transcript_14892:129-713(-)|eukprot:CAMPEP_0184990966 /NCGR_PEP_ID=MMETSP1098-20130426/34691_1 /TAXON_ID=89044 /ORGANISM="Spumella elongata, Strain CCAP 955/1" /LENGTH=194 /DNA_ID=CAMNT_0027516279 /DNA_START=48 /DNA_END=632 /DNA_ORIENTATION=-